MNTLLETINYKGFDIAIHYDDTVFFDNPNDWNENSQLVTWHKRECFIESKHFDTDDAQNMLGAYIKDEGYEEYKDELKELQKDWYIFPIDAYIHSGVALSLASTGTQCQFDTSSYIGVLFVSKKEAKNKKQAEKYARQEIKTWNQYINGEIYEYMIDEPVNDSCGGFYGYDHKESGLLENAQNAIDYYLEQKEKEKQQKTKAYIQNHVPLEKRLIN